MSLKTIFVEVHRDRIPSFADICNDFYQVVCMAADFGSEMNTAYVSSETYNIIMDAASRFKYKNFKSFTTEINMEHFKKCPIIYGIEILEIKYDINDGWILFGYCDVPKEI